MANIRLTPDELNQHGMDLQKMSEELETLLGNLDTKIATVCDQWDGLSQNAFLASYEGMKDTLRQFPQIVLGFGKQVSGAAEAFGSADSELAKAFEG